MSEIHTHSKYKYGFILSSHDTGFNKVAYNLSILNKKKHDSTKFISLICRGSGKKVPAKRQHFIQEKNKSAISRTSLNCSDGRERKKQNHTHSAQDTYEAKDITRSSSTSTFFFSEDQDSSVPYLPPKITPCQSNMCCSCTCCSNMLSCFVRNSHIQHEKKEHHKFNSTTQKSFN